MWSRANRQSALIIMVLLNIIMLSLPYSLYHIDCNRYCKLQLPEMSSSAESEEFGKVRTFILQNVGLLSGFGIIFLLAVFGREISFE